MQINLRAVFTLLVCMKKRTLLSKLSALIFPLAGTLAAIFPAVSAVASEKISVEPLPPLVVEGTEPAQGVAGAFIAVAPDGSCVAVAGGCNFPDKGPADGGKKVFFKTLWTLDLGKILSSDGENNALAWEVAPEELARPVAYGMCAGGQWLGGENSETKMDSARIAPFSASAGVLVPLPQKIDNAAAAFSEKTGEIFVAGGNADGEPTNHAWILKKTESSEFPSWAELENFPGKPRVQPVAGTLETPRGEAFVLVGGFFFDKEKNEATLDRGGVIFYPKENRWEKIPPLPAEISGAGLVGSVAVEDGRGGLLIFGGVNAGIFKNALEKPAADYLRHEPEWYKFNADVLRLSFDADGRAVWENLGRVPATARAGASVARLGDSDEFIFVCGELKPGFRSPDCVRLKIRFDDVPAH